MRFVELGALGHEDPTASPHTLTEEGTWPHPLIWDPTKTRVVSGPAGFNKFPGKAFPDKRAARAYWTEKCGRILEEYPALGRYIFRVAK